MKIVTIGREQGNTIVISNDINISRKHLEMIQDDLGNIQLTDLNSTNGTTVNGRRLAKGESVYLSLTDVVRIGNKPLPWRTYFSDAGENVIAKSNKEKKKKEKKTIKWRNVLSIVMTIFSLIFMFFMFYRMFKGK